MPIAITTITPNTATIANIFNPCCLEGVVDGDSPGCVASSVDSTDCFAVLGCVVVVVSSISSNTILIVVSVSGSSVRVSILVDALYPGVIWVAVIFSIVSLCSMASVSGLSGDASPSRLPLIYTLHSILQPITSLGLPGMYTSTLYVDPGDSSTVSILVTIMYCPVVQQSHLLPQS